MRSRDICHKKNWNHQKRLREKTLEANISYPADPLFKAKNKRNLFSSTVDSVRSLVADHRLSLEVKQKRASSQPQAPGQEGGSQRRGWTHRLGVAVERILGTPRCHPSLRPRAVLGSWLPLCC